MRTYVVQWFVMDSDGWLTREAPADIVHDQTPMGAINQTVYGARKETLCGKLWWQVIECKPDATGDITIYEGTQERIEMEYNDATDID